jgi:hypothetical protein
MVLGLRSLSRLARRMIALIIFAGCLLAASYAPAQDIRFDSGKSALKIPFELRNNQIYLQIPVNGSKPLWLVLDTASGTLLGRSAAQKIGLKLRETGEFQSKGPSQFKYALTNNMSFKLPGAIYKDQTLGVVAFEDLEKCLGHAADGILGLEFFESAVVEIDYKNRFLNIYEAKSYKYSGSGESFSLEPLSNGLVTVRAEITPKDRPPITGKFMVDTGFALSLLLNSPFVEKNKLLTEGQGEALSICGFGEEKSVKDKVAAVRLGGFKFNNATTLFAQTKSGTTSNDDQDGLLGGEILSQYKVIFDYSRKQMILEPYSKS